MKDDIAKRVLQQRLRGVRESVVWKLEGLSEYGLRRPLTVSGTNLLGLAKHLALWEARYLGDVFDRPFPEPLPSWDDPAAAMAHLWVTADETREAVIGRYQRVWRHSDATVEALPLDATGFVPWWPRPHITLFDAVVHVLTETSRHAGHVDILREQLDGLVGTDPEQAETLSPEDPAAAAFRAQIDEAARAAAAQTARPD